MSLPERPAGAETTPEQEEHFHDYRGSAIPWYVRLMWLGFWLLAIYYVVTYLIPAMQAELIAPP